MSAEPQAISAPVVHELKNSVASKVLERLPNFRVDVPIGRVNFSETRLKLVQVCQKKLLPRGPMIPNDREDIVLPGHLVGLGANQLDLVGLDERWLDDRCDSSPRGVAIDAVPRLSRRDC